MIYRTFMLPIQEMQSLWRNHSLPNNIICIITMHRWADRACGACGSLIYIQMTK